MALPDRRALDLGTRTAVELERKDGFVHVSWNDGTTQRSGWVSEQYTQTASAPAAPLTGPLAGQTMQPDLSAMWVQVGYSFRW